MALKFDYFSLNQHMTDPEMELYHYNNSDNSFRKVQPHRHNHYEFYFFRSGNAKYIVAGHQYELLPGDFLVIDPGQLHYPELQAGSKQQNYERYVFWVNAEFLAGILDRYPALRSLWNVKGRTGSALFRPSREAFRMLDLIQQSLVSAYRAEDDPFRTASLHSIFVELLITMCRIAEAQSYSVLPQKSLDLYSHIVDYIHSHIRENITLDVLSEELYASKSYISRVFREHLSMSVHQYILRLKTEHILEEARSGRPVTEAAVDYGFSSYSSFYRYCSKEFGMSPRELLKEENHHDQSIE